jgi:lysophospholipase L1-like esterase
MVAQAMSFDGTNSLVFIADSAALRPALFTIEAWVQFSSLDSAAVGASPAGQQYIVFKQSSLYGTFEGYFLGKARLNGADRFSFIVASAAGVPVELQSATTVHTGIWYHVAAVRGTNFLQLYVNGQLESQGEVGFPQNYASNSLYFGTSGQAYWDHKFAGLLDEVSLYNQPMAAADIAAIYAAGSDGKCKSAMPPERPVILVQPQWQVVTAGSNAMFTVAAAGTSPLSYQWRKNGLTLVDGGTISGAASSSLALTGTSTNDAGSYTVIVSNFAGFVQSAPAALTVTIPVPPPWESSDIGAVWSDDFNRASLGTNWVVLGGASASVVSNEFHFQQTNYDSARQVYYQPWLISSDQWTLRWRQRFEALDSGSAGVGVGIKNFQVLGGDDRGYNALLGGAGANLGRILLQRWDGGSQVLAATGPALTLAVGDIIDCSLTRSGWTMTATATNRANGQVSSASLTFAMAASLVAPTISRACFYPIGGTVDVDDVSFTINHRKPARFVLIGASGSEGYNASTYAQGYPRVLQNSFAQAVCNDSSSFNVTANSLSVLPEILAHQPDTALLMIGGNDLLFGVPPSQWQSNYASLVSQLQARGVRVKHCVNTPRNATDLRPLRAWIYSNYPASDIIDTFSALLTGSYSLNPAYDSGDGLHPNDAGHLLIAQTIASNLPPGGPSLNLVLRSAAAGNYAIETSPDLIHWSQLRQVTSTDGTIRVTDPVVQARGFYRSRLLP